MAKLNLLNINILWILLVNMPQLHTQLSQDRQIQIPQGEGTFGLMDFLMFAQVEIFAP